MNKKRQSLMPREWLSLAGLTCAAFVFNTSEFSPIGLLTDIARDFGKTEAGAGLLISVYAWVVTVLSLPLMLLVSRMDLRRLLLWVVALFAAFQCVSWLSSSFGMLMMSRIGVACTHSIFWSIVAPIAVRVVPDEFRSVALGTVVTGSSLAIILGLPLGRVIGLEAGWRITFLCIALAALLTFIWLLLSLPSLPSRGRFSVRKLPQLFGNPTLAGLYLFTFLVATAYYTCYSYIEPFFKQVAGMSDQTVTAALIFFGCAGLVGSMLFSKYYMLNRYRFMTCVLMVLMCSLLLLDLLSFSLLLTIVLCLFWGTCVTAYNVGMQSEIISLSPPEATAVSMSIFSGIFNLGIGCGALAGGFVCTHASIAYIGFAGGLIALIALAYWQFRLRHLVSASYGSAK